MPPQTKRACSLDLSWRASSVRCLAATIFLACILIGCRATQHDSARVQAAGRPFPFPGISGMAALDDGSFLVIHDARDPRNPRAGIFIPTAPTKYSTIPIHDEILPGGPLADLESLASVPGRPSHFLLLESGSALPGERRRRALVLALLSPPPQRALRVLAFHDVRELTSDLADCEGLLCWTARDQLFVAIANRGSDGAGSLFQAKVVVGRLTLPAPGQQPGSLEFKPVPPGDMPQASVISFKADDAASWRACSELFIDEHNIVWGASTTDPGNAGPFRSFVYTAGSLDPVSGVLTLREAQVKHKINGFKVEAIAGVTNVGADFSVGTDDEDYGGTWRPLPALPVSP